MAISSTTFEERLARINNGQTVDQAAILGTSKTRRSFRARCLTFPFMVGVGILTGGTAYAFATSPADMQWVMALAG
ncbi:hypothetical protein [Sulfitobacter geojensis]|jgi:hypothetical protein|uniref:Uncharacterized protein n=1 Tax=Sulfitobacter geojensis TaxID=1342299 RepID=A0AAE2VXI7_9RHOB|nr:hypothetical protein [Sulfitobacter geojensis]KHA51770.1 hypothetical protein Z947_2058 [Sulfitobacter geojensis]MBM1688841.1 hypothetical protein [Sulfitobacter geojensis]MBM1692908.1 hypothetical protein [Sulfitobacter geojensis]MBM1705074.1 hypothetical protein [Sulfitobacter geojensis]MBM1709132.1 hypothetical protein [Sulfitobacter geojensis]